MEKPAEIAETDDYEEKSPLADSKPNLLDKALQFYRQSRKLYDIEQLKTPKTEMVFRI